MASRLIPKAPQPVHFVDLKKSAGILDDYAVRKNVATKEGTIEQVPTEDNHIVNKKYVDDEIAGIVISKSFVITNPTASKSFAVWKTPTAITITAVHCVQVGGTNVIGILTECDADGLNPAVIDTTDITVLATNVNKTSFTNPSIDAGDYVGWNTTSVSGNVTKLIITFEYTI